MTPSAEGERNKQRLFCCQMWPEVSACPLARRSVPWSLGIWALCLAQAEHGPGIQRCPACQKGSQCLLRGTMPAHKPCPLPPHPSSPSCPGPHHRTHYCIFSYSPHSIPRHLWSGTCRHCPSKYLPGKCPLSFTVRCVWTFPGTTSPGGCPFEWRQSG